MTADYRRSIDAILTCVDFSSTVAKVEIGFDINQSSSSPILSSSFPTVMSSTSSPSLDPAVLANYPAGTPPPGVNYHFVNPENHGPDLIIIGSILVTIMIFCVIGRIYTKTRVTRIFSWDDGDFTSTEI